MTKDDAGVVASQYAGVCKNDMNDVKVFGKVCGSREVGNKLLHRSVARARARERRTIMRRILQLLPLVDPGIMKRIIGTVKFPAKRKYPDSNLKYLHDDDDEPAFHTVPVYRLKKARHERMVGTLCPRRSGALVDPHDWPLACISCDPNWALGIRFADLPLSNRTIEKSMNRVVEEFKKKSIPYSCLSMREEGTSSSRGRRARFISLPILPFFFLHSPWDLTEGGGRLLE